jgi:hypothetical protein
MPMNLNCGPNDFLSIGIFFFQYLLLCALCGELLQIRKVIKGLKNLERTMGIEPTYEAWEASILPLNYARII